MNEHEKNSIDDFAQRFRDLQTEAEGYGICSIMAISQLDPLSREEFSASGYRGGKYTCLGLASMMAGNLRRETMEGWEKAD